VRFITQKTCVQDGTSRIATGLTYGGQAHLDGQRFVLRHVQLSSRRRIGKWLRDLTDIARLTGGIDIARLTGVIDPLRGSAEPSSGALCGMRVSGLTFEPATPLS
jgi:hypothetical protein